MLIIHFVPFVKLWTFCSDPSRPKQKKQDSYYFFHTYIGGVFFTRKRIQTYFSKDKEKPWKPNTVLPEFIKKLTHGTSISATGKVESLAAVGNNTANCCPFSSAVLAALQYHNYQLYISHINKKYICMLNFNINSAYFNIHTKRKQNRKTDFKIITLKPFFWQKKKHYFSCWLRSFLVRMPYLII